MRSGLKGMTGARWLRLCALALLLATGCGVHANQQAASQPPAAEPPAQPPPVASQGGTVSIRPQYAATGPAQTLQFSAGTPGGAVEWLVNGIAGGNAAVGTVSTTGTYTAPAALPQSTNVVVTAALTASPSANFATAVVSVIDPGKVFATANPQVATYSIYLPAPGQMHVEFGPTVSYGLPTWTQPTPSRNGGQVNLYVAGMRGQTQYHMRALVTLADGATYTDTDQTFSTGTPPGTAAVTTSTTSGQTPQPGIELFNTLLPYQPARAFATDLSGSVLWTYSDQGTHQDAVQPIKLLPNGHFLVQLSYLSSLALRSAAILPNTLDEVREVDLAGNTVRSLTQAQLAAALTAQGYTFTLGSLHHDVLPLPNGHMVLLATIARSFTGLPGYAGKTLNVIGDILVDVDQNFTPDWVWNSFDHLDVNRHPYLFPDWTHSNSMLYSADDHNLLLSVRHQNWILKIDFNDGKGSGNIVWKLGEGGDFQLKGGADPVDWFYAQHDPAYFSPNTSGVFKLGVMDNGDDRPLPDGTICSQPAKCDYSTVPVYLVDENARTATLIEHYVPPPSLYSYFGGNVDLLGNGNLEADFCGVSTGAVVQELNMRGGATPQLVWQAVTQSSSQYRAERLPSLYPGVQW